MKLAVAFLLMYAVWFTARLIVRSITYSTGGWQEDGRQR